MGAQYHLGLESLEVLRLHVPNDFNQSYSIAIKIWISMYG